MNTVRVLTVLAVMLVVIPATSNAQDKPKKNFLSALKEGQSIVLKENAGRYEILVMKDVRLGHTVIEVGTDYVVLEDPAGVMETRIHIMSIKSIIRLKLPKE